MSIRNEHRLSLFALFGGAPAMGRSPAGRPGGRPNIKTKKEYIDE